MHAPQGYGSRSVCVYVCVPACLSVCLSVCLSFTTFSVTSFIFMLQNNNVKLVWYALDFYKHDFCENASFRSYGIIYSM